MNKLNLINYFNSIKILLVLFIIYSNFTLSQQKNKNFEGILLYKMSYNDSINIHNNYNSEMKIYIKDSFVRIETENAQLGKQIVIKNIKQKKLYILLEYNDVKYAIQQHIVDDSLKSVYTYKYKIGKSKINNYFFNKVDVYNSKTKKHNNIYVYKKIRTHVLDVYKGIKFLPAIYDITDEYGRFTYNLTQIKEEKCNLDLFGIPTNYKRISFDDFIREASNSN